MWSFCPWSEVLNSEGDGFRLNWLRQRSSSLEMWSHSPSTAVTRLQGAAATAATATAATATAAFWLCHSLRVFTPWELTTVTSHRSGSVIVKTADEGIQTSGPASFGRFFFWGVSVSFSFNHHRPWRSYWYLSGALIEFCLLKRRQTGAKPNLFRLKARTRWCESFRATCVITLLCSWHCCVGADPSAGWRWRAGSWRLRVGQVWHESCCSISQDEHTDTGSVKTCVLLPDQHLSDKKPKNAPHFLEDDAKGAEPTATSRGQGCQKMLQDSSFIKSKNQTWGEKTGLRLFYSWMEDQSVSILNVSLCSSGVF